MGKWGRCMILGVEVGCTKGDRATTGPIDISGICRVSGVSPDISDIVNLINIPYSALQNSTKWKLHL